MKHTNANINTPAYWDEVYRAESVTSRQRVDSVRLGQLERWVRVREGETQQPASILDYGCGRGDALFGLWASRRDRALCGVDISEEARVAVAAERYSLGAHDVAVADTHNFGEMLAAVRDPGNGIAHGGLFDVIWCGETLEHVDQPSVLIGEFRELLRDGGFLVLSTPFKGRNTSPEHVWEFSPSDVTAWAEAVGELVFLDCLSLPGWLTMFAVIRRGRHS